MGLISSSDEFNIRSHNAVAPFFDWLLKIVDDIAIQGKDLQTVFQQLRMVLEACRVAGIKLSLESLELEDQSNLRVSLLDQMAFGLTRQNWLLYATFQHPSL